MTDVLRVVRKDDGQLQYTWGNRIRVQQDVNEGTTLVFSVAGNIREYAAFSELIGEATADATAAEYGRRRVLAAGLSSIDS